MQSPADVARAGRAERAGSPDPAGRAQRRPVPGRDPAAVDPSSPVPTGEDDELATRLRVAVTRLNRRLRQQSLAGLSPSQAAVLGSIDRLGSPTLGELALAEQVQPPTMTRLMAGMERDGLVVRYQDAEDRRVWRVRLSIEGRRTLQRIHRLKNAFLTRRMAALDEEERARARELTELLERLVADQ